MFLTPKVIWRKWLVLKKDKTSQWGWKQTPHWILESPIHTVWWLSSRQTFGKCMLKLILRSTHEKSVLIRALNAQYTARYNPYIGVSKNRGGYPKMDGENNGKPLFFNDDFGGKPTIFGKHLYGLFNSKFICQWTYVQPHGSDEPSGHCTDFSQPCMRKKNMVYEYRNTYVSAHVHIKALKQYIYIITCT